VDYGPCSVKERTNRSLRSPLDETTRGDPPPLAKPSCGSCERSEHSADGGESRIRTHGTVSPTRAFQTCSFNKGSGSGDRCTLRRPSWSRLSARQSRRPPTNASPTQASKRLQRCCLTECVVQKKKSLPFSGRFVRRSRQSAEPTSMGGRNNFSDSRRTIAFA